MGKGGDSVGHNPVFYGSAECRLKGKVSGDKKKLTLQSSWHICSASAQGRFGWVGHLCKVCDLGNIGPGDTKGSVSSVGLSAKSHNSLSVRKFLPEI